MSQRRRLERVLGVALLVFGLGVCLWRPAVLLAQTGPSFQELDQRATELVKQQKYVEALPLLEKLVALEPDNPRGHFYLGFALLAQGNTKRENTDERKSLRARARQAFLKAKELGITEPVIDGLIQSIPADGSDGKAFSTNAEANKLMNEAEALFSRGKLDDAFKNYQKALALDPKIYEAALFSGDVYMQKGDFDQAEIWYQKAVAINPDKETAYRYSATPLMKQGKHAQARDRYVEAYVSEPYNSFSSAGLTQWAKITNTALAHPQIDIPTDVTFDEKGDAKVSLSPDALAGGKEDGSFAWASYGATRLVWRKEKFRQTFPGERAYRHSLAEEADALRGVLKLAAGDDPKKTLSPSLAKLKKLDDEGLLEAYILLARADQGVASDFPAYRSQHRDKLRRYVVEYVLTGGGKRVWPTQ